MGENDEFVDFSLNPEFVEFSTNKDIVKRIEIDNFMVKSRSSIGKRISSNNLKKLNLNNFKNLFKFH